MINEPVFDQLRTKEQLGYVVSSSMHEAYTTMGYRITIQSGKAPLYLEDRIDSFLIEFTETLEMIEELEFNC